MANFAESLRRTTIDTQEQIARELAARQEKAKKTKQANQTARRQRIANFVAENLDPTTEEIKEDAKTSAEKGETEVSKTWRIELDEEERESKEEADKYLELRDQTAQYFTEMGLATTLIDKYDGHRYTDPVDLIPSFQATAHLVGLTVSWAETEQQ